MGEKGRVKIPLQLQEVRAGDGHFGVAWFGEKPRDHLNISNGGREWRLTFDEWLELGKPTTVTVHVTA